MMIVIKFGGSSVADRQQIEKVANIIKSRADQPQVVISSAHKGVTSQLIESAHQAAQGHLDIPQALARQQQICQSLGCPDACLKALYEELTALLRGISLVRELSARTLDYVASFGERMSVRVIAWYLRQQGLNALPFDAWELGLISDSNFGAARPIEGYQQAIAKHRPTFENVIPVVTGFIAKDQQGNITTLGRNGSDLSATLFAEALVADSCEIWSDTDGVMSADPGLVANARNIPQMSFREASELARFGSRILHPASLEPVTRAAIPLLVMNTNAPEHPGTLIRQTTSNHRDQITSIAYKEHQTIVTINSSAMLQHSGFLAEIFTILGRYQIVVDMISTSEVSLSFSTESSAQLSLALQELKAFSDCEVVNNKTIIAIVAPQPNDFIRYNVDVLAILQAQQIDTEMLSLGYRSINLMLLIDDVHISQAVQSLHNAFFTH
ncbi:MULTISPECIES: aspartate kinase [Amphritea]|uniref:aspartate kinase n=1 Tax=Amphritea TaxID=515417 RepID=UPI001C07E428|nr:MULTISPECIES: aspartate kinase [Amphritea]MBU2965793.1 aspartate kinase [Amphritea atlantica]MDX2424502.1 aspartate kinase [Amphritea sp.]